MNFSRFLRKSLFIISTVALTLKSAHALEPLTTIKIEEGSLTWVMNDVISGSQTRINFGSVGQHIAFENWGSGQPEVATVAHDQTKNLITLRTQAASFTTKNGDYFFPIPDTNSNGAAEFVTIQDIRGSLVWYINLDPLQSASLKRFRLGRTTQTPFYFRARDRRGTEHAVFAVLKANGRNAIINYMSLDRRVRGSNTLRGLPGSYLRSPEPLVPIRVRGLLNDCLLVTWQRGNTTFYRIINPTASGRRVRTVIKTGRFEGTGTVLVGQWLNNLEDQVALATDSGVEIQALSGETLTLSYSQLGIRSESIPVDLHNINSFTPQANEADRCGALLTGDRDRFGCYIQNPTNKPDGFIDGPGGYVWKANSDTQYWAVTLPPERFTGCVEKVETFDTSMNLIQRMEPKGAPANGNRQAYMSAGRTGANYRREFGSIYVRSTLKNGACFHYFITNPHRRYD